MNKALQNIKIPPPKDSTLEEKAKYDKLSGYINENFKTLFDSVDELSRSMKTQEELNAQMGELKTTLDEINKKLDELGGNS